MPKLRVNSVENTIVKTYRKIVFITHSSGKWNYKIFNSFLKGLLRYKSHRLDSSDFSSVRKNEESHNQSDFTSSDPILNSVLKSHGSLYKCFTLITNE